MNRSVVAALVQRREKEPSCKLQAAEKSKAPISRDGEVGEGVPGAWCLELLWSLVLGVWSLFSEELGAWSFFPDACWVSYQYFLYSQPLRSPNRFCSPAPPSTPFRAKRFLPARS